MPRRSIQENIRRKRLRDEQNAIDLGEDFMAPPAPKRKRRDLGQPFIAPMRAVPSASAAPYIPPPSLASSSRLTAAAQPAHSAYSAAYGQPALPAPPLYIRPAYPPPAATVNVPHYPQYPTVNTAPEVVVPIAPKVKKPRRSAAEKAADDAAKPVVESRPARFRVRAPKATMERAERVMSQRMFMMDRERIRDGDYPAERFAVLGSTGNVYRVTIDFNPLCDCPDCLKGNVPCKHIVFIFLKVLKLPLSSTIWYQKGLTNSELKHVFAQAPPDPSDPHNAPAAVRAAYLTATGRGEQAEVVAAEPAPADRKKPKSAAVGEDCAVCYEEMTKADLDGSRLVFDESSDGCGNALHRECFQMWATTARSKGDPVTCVYCRAAWDDGSKGKGKAKAGAGGPSFSSMGYMNMADMAGVSRERDTSSYYQGPMRGQGLWEIKNRYRRD